jgi:hypothetical protein
MEYSIPGSASFIRPPSSAKTSLISLGRPFLQAIRSKYTDNSIETSSEYELNDKVGRRLEVLIDNIIQREKNWKIEDVEFLNLEAEDVNGWGDEPSLCLASK